ncbi:hypothetical protein CJ177_34735 [Rhodococcus sp. ACPA1]|nr:hypothetical protein CJ177_34735 [Rhodococcus sp. ACPA1]
MGLSRVNLPDDPVSQLGSAHENQPPRIRPVLILIAATSPAILMAIGVLPLNGWGVVAAAVADGLTASPIQAATRTITPALVPAFQHTALHSFDALSREIV